MGLNAFDGLAGIGPDLDLAIVATRVAPSLFVKADTGEESGSVLSAHDTWLLETLGHVGGVPEANLLGGHRGEAKIICSLGPGDIEDLVRGAIHGKKVLAALNIVDAHLVVIRVVHGGYVARAGRDSAGNDTSGAIRKVEFSNCLSCFGAPHMNSGCWTRITGDDSFAISTNVNGQNIVPMLGAFRVVVLGRHLSRLASIELLLASSRVHDDAHGGDHVAGLA